MYRLETVINNRPNKYATDDEKLLMENIMKTYTATQLHSLRLELLLQSSNTPANKAKVEVINEILRKKI
jgi:hypothetical protein